MRLLYSPASPYSRKVRIVLREKNLHDQVEEILANPFGDAAELQRANPLGKIPALLVEPGFALYDSPVICEYLDTLVPTAPLLPATGPARWQVLRCQALADGLLDAAVASVYESRRPPAEQSATVVARWREQIERALAVLPAQLDALPAAFNLGHVAAASALGYLDLRFPDWGWRSAQPKLKNWFEDISQRPSLQQTVPF